MITRLITSATNQLLRDDLHRIEELHTKILAREKEITNNFHIEESLAAIAIHNFRHLELVFLAEGYRDPLAVPLKETPWRFGSASDRLPNIGSLHQVVLQGDAARLIQLNRLDATTIQILEQSLECIQSLDQDCFLFCM